MIKKKKNTFFLKTPEANTFKLKSKTLPNEDCKSGPLKLPIGHKLWRVIQESKTVGPPNKHFLLTCLIGSLRFFWFIYNIT